MTDTYESPLPSRGSIPPPSQERLPGLEHTADGPEKRLTAKHGLLGLLLAVVATFVFAGIAAVAFGADGDTSDDHAFQFVATFAGDVALVLTAYFMTARLGRVVPATFGFRSFRPSALGWVALAFVSYLVLAAIYTVIVDPPAEDLPEQLGADESVLLAVLTGVFVVVVAPLAEEFFFRGFMYQALRNSWGTILGVLGSAAIFSAIHGEPDKFVPLLILGIAFAMLFQKTRSLWPCIILHAINNSLAFAVSL